METQKARMASMRCETTLLMLLVLLLLFFSAPMAMAMGYRGEVVGEREEMFLLQRSKVVVKTEAGEVSVMRGYSNTGGNSMHIGFITMEPNTLFIPQYMDSALILFIRSGSAKLGWIYRNKMVEKELKIGDVYRIPAGSTFYMVNTAEEQKLHIICSIDTSESSGTDDYQTFFIGGGKNPTSVLAGFDLKTLETAFNVSWNKLDELMKRKHGEAIIYITNPDQPGKWASFMQLKQQEREAHLQYQGEEEEEEIDLEEEKYTKWTWRKLLNSVFGKEEMRERSLARSTGAYNIYNKKPDFQNSYGSSLAIDEKHYKPLKHSDIGVYLVNLTKGSMLAPHMNPTATEYGIVLKGSGSIQVVFPNGTSAMKAKVKEGDTFWIPRYFPFCQIASTSGPMEFFGFTTSARKNHPQFLVGATSILHTMNGPELARSFGITEKQLTTLVNAQHESIILPSSEHVAPPSNPPQKKLIEPVASYLHSFADDMIMGFD